MPPKFSARQLFWTGIALTAVGVFVGQYLVTIVITLWGEHAISSSPLPSILQPVDALLVPLGAVVLACSLIARTIESQTTPVSHLHASGRRALPPRLTAKQILWAGIVLVTVGLILTASIGDFFMQLSGSSDVSANLARDLLGFVGVPLTAVAVPLGIALVPCAFVVRMLESRVDAQHKVGADEFSRS